MKLHKFFLKSLNEELVSLITLMNRFNKNIEIIKFFVILISFLFFYCIKEYFVNLRVISRLVVN